MKKSIKNHLITWSIIIIILIISAIVLYKPTKNVEADLAKCIGEKSTLYVQLGCPHCKEQEDLFGENLKFINIVDCFYEPEKCQEIMYVPTWKIGDTKITGVQSIEKLKELTGC
jgi:glutaredoxin